MKEKNVTPNRWRSFALAMLAAGMAGGASAQVNYTQNWNSGTSVQGWVDMGGVNSSAFSVFTGTTSCDGTSTGRSMRTLMQNSGANRAVRSPQVGTSTGGVTTLTFDYKVAINSANTVGAQATSFTFEAFWGTSTSGPWQSLGVINSTNHVVSGTCAPAPGTYTFTPAAGNQVYIRFLVTRFAEAILVSFDNVSVQETPPVPCSGTPALGATVSSRNVACAGSTVNLNVENPTTDSGIAYQWYFSIDGGAEWEPGPSTATWNGAMIYDETMFYVEATCEGTSTSTPVTVTLGDFAMCGNYCVTGVGNDNTNHAQVLSVALAGENHDINYVFTACPVGTVGVVNLLDHQADLLPGATYTLTVDFNTCGNSQSSTGEVWIDFNRNAAFNPIESLGAVVGTSAQTANSSFSFTVPVDAVPGPTRMRVMQRTNGSNGFPPLDPCFGGVGQYTWGSVMDFKINILEQEACTAIPAPGATISSQPTACNGAAITLSTATPPLASGITYQWYSSTNGGSTWVPGPTTATWNGAVYTGVTTMYYCAVTCSGQGTGNSTPVTVGLSTQCYCTPTGSVSTVRPITLVQFAGIANSSCSDDNCDAAYRDYTAGTPGMVEAGSSYLLTTRGAGTGTGYYTAFFDWDRDGVFEFAQNIGTVGVGANVNTSTTITVPPTALPGTTRMRILRRPTNWSPTPPLACTAYNQGQVEDYTILVSLPCNNDLVFETTGPEGSALPTWQVFDAVTNALMASSSVGSIPGDTPYPQDFCLPNGNFYMTVSNVAAGVTYKVRGADMPFDRIIDNSSPSTGSHQVETTATSGGTIQLPMSQDRVLMLACDKYWWKSGDYLVANENVEVKAIWDNYAANSTQRANTGYDFWFYDPNGTYSFVRERRHNQSDGYANVGSARTCHMRVNGWNASVQAPLPQGVVLNVRVRAVVNGVPGAWGPACRFVRDEVMAACPPTTLWRTPITDVKYSCDGATRRWTTHTNQRIYAHPVSGATQYNFRFTNVNEGYDVTRTVNTYYLNMAWNAAAGAPLVVGSQYQVTVQANKGGTLGPNNDGWCTVGDACTITICNAAGNCGSGMVGDDQNSLTSEQAGAAQDPALTLWPNPNNGQQLHLDLTGLGTTTGTLTVDIHDLSGKRVAAREMALQQGTMVLDLNGALSTGMYLMRINAAGEQFTERLVINE